MAETAETTVTKGIAMSHHISRIMNYQTYQPRADLETIVKCYWTLEVPASTNAQRQLILPDGCVDLCFILGDDIKRYTTETDFVLQPREMLLGQITERFYIEPTGYVNTFAIRFYPYGFANFIDLPLNELRNKETPIKELFGEETARRLSQEIAQAKTVYEQIDVVEKFLVGRLNEEATIDNIVRSTIDAILLSNGSKPVNTMLKDEPSKRRQLERNFNKLIGLSPKQLSKVIRLQSTLKMLLDRAEGTFTAIAYQHEYYDQAHFIKDFKEFTGRTPKEFLTDEQMALSTILYKKG